jgi:hypothetical protein
MSTKLSDAQERVLRYLYEHKDDDGALSEQKVSDSTGLRLPVVKRALTELTEMGMVSGPDSLLARSARTLKEIDATFTETSAGFAEAIILIASVIEKADESYLTDALQYDREFVALVGSRLRAAGIWLGEDVPHAKLWEQDPISLFLDMKVATGDLMVVGGTPSNPAYKMTESGNPSPPRKRMAKRKE